MGEGPSLFWLAWSNTTMEISLRRAGILFIDNRHARISRSSSVNHHGHEPMPAARVSSTVIVTSSLSNCSRPDEVAICCKRKQLVRQTLRCLRFHLKPSSYHRTPLASPAVSLTFHGPFSDWRPQSGIRAHEGPMFSAFSFSFGLADGNPAHRRTISCRFQLLARRAVGPS